MKEINFDHTFACSVDTFWDRIFFDPEFNRAMFKDYLGFPDWNATVKEDTPQVRKQTVTVRPPVGTDIPAPVKRAIGDNFGYKEHGTFDKEKKRYSVQVEPNVAADKANVKGEIWVERIDDNKCRRLAKFTIDVKIMMVGKVIEDIIAKNMSQSFDKGADFTNEWIGKGKVD